MPDDYAETDQEPEVKEIVAELSEEERQRLEVIQVLLEPCDRITYGQKQREAATKLGKSVRTVRRLVKKWESEGLTSLQNITRSDKGKHRIRELERLLVRYIVDKYNQSIDARLGDQTRFQRWEAGLIAV